MDLADPLHEEAIVVTILPQAGSAFMRELTGSLQHKEAVLGSRPEDTPNTSSRKVISVLPWLESKEGELEAVLSSDLSVTASAITTMTGKERDDLVGEAYGNFFVVPFHRDRSDSAAGTLPGGRDGSGPVAQGT